MIGVYGQPSRSVSALPEGCFYDMLFGMILDAYIPCMIFPVGQELSLSMDEEVNK